MGGAAFSMSMVWAQAFPFVALQLYVGETKGSITTFLIGSFGLWLLLNIAFFCTINLKFLNTFFGTKTAPQYTVELFRTNQDASEKFRAAFKNRSSYTESIHEEVKEWVTANIARWKREKPEWFKISTIPDDILPDAVLEAEGGAKRKRSVVILREIVGLPPAKIEQQLPQEPLTMTKERWKNFAESIYETRSTNHKANYTQLKKVFVENIELLAPVMVRCPNFRAILSYMLVDKFGLRVRKIDKESLMENWTTEDCQKVGNSFATFIRQRNTGPEAIVA